MKATVGVSPASVPQSRRGPLVLQIVRAILWSFLGIRKRVDLHADFERLPLVPVIAGGLIAAAVFVGSLLLVVRVVVQAAA